MTILVGAGVGLREPSRVAEACTGPEYGEVGQLTTFDPKVIGEPIAEGLYYDPMTPGFAPCEGCAEKDQLEDWTRFLPEVALAEWQHLVYKSPAQELADLGRQLASGKASAAPLRDYPSLARVAAKDTLIAALAYLQLARKIEPFATFEASDPDAPAQQLPEALVTEARAGMRSAAAKQPFLAQRYAFQAIRATFYRRDWAGVIALFDKNLPVVNAPSASLAWSARQYVAGALMRSKSLARANLELARIHAAYPPLSAAAVNAFTPATDASFRESLRLATTVREKAELWRLVGIKADGLAAAQEIAKLDPRSPQIGLLLVRELARVETMIRWTESDVTAQRRAAQHKAFARLEQTASAILAKGGDRPWLLHLVIGHLAAKRGDLATARARLASAAAARPDDVRVANQARASLAVALATSWKATPTAETELAATMAALAPGYDRAASVQEHVRVALARYYAAAGKPVEAEYLWPGTVDLDPATGQPLNAKSRWTEVAFLEELIARGGKVTTPFDKFVVLGSSIRRPQLDEELAMRHVLDGNFSAAAALLPTRGPGAGVRMETDPFAMRIVDCHDCDHLKYASSMWTRASMVKKLVELEGKVKQGGEDGAEAALQIGNVLYNMTWHGNARVILDGTHQATTEAKAAERWYRKAYELAKNRERKARAAFYAAKAELGTRLARPDMYEVLDTLPVPQIWFPILKQYATTQFHKEVLRECGHYARWAGRGY